MEARERGSSSLTANAATRIVVLREELWICIKGPCGTYIGFTLRRLLASVAPFVGRNGISQSDGIN
jgi:hypothetical protein